uniref:Uncharacterized protein n=1 Tax=Arundo donax TaxID=35708 RepID=A0A0A9GSI4_ARUDO
MEDLNKHTVTTVTIRNMHVSSNVLPFCKFAETRSVL